jgi:pimeloyl-ACP methyl ester carboxylesterase
VQDVCLDGVELAWREIGSGRPFVSTPANALRAVSVPTLVILGDRDSRGTSADSLAALLANGRLVLVPGDHVTGLGAPEFTTAVLEFVGTSLPANALGSRQ